MFKHLCNGFGREIASLTPLGTQLCAPQQRPQIIATSMSLRPRLHR